MWLHRALTPGWHTAVAAFSLALSLCSGCSKSTFVTPAPRTSAVQVVVKPDSVTVDTPVSQFVLLPSGYLRASLLREGKQFSLDSAAPAEESSDSMLDLASAKVTEANGKLGALGKRIQITGKRQPNLEEEFTLEVYDEFSNVALISSSYKNVAGHDQQLDTISLASRNLDASLADSRVSPYDMWSFHGASIRWGKDDVLPMAKKFSQKNLFGVPVETKGDLGRVGGGIPVVAFWTRSVGEAIGHVETLPLSLSIPVSTQPDGHVRASVQLSPTILKPGEIYSTPRVFVAVYSGDFYEPLSVWSKIVDREGLSRPANNNENYAISWGGWGYEEDVTPKQMVNTIPKLKELGIHWATLDDRWCDNYGDWQPRSDTFPGDSIQRMVKAFHDEGIKVQLWWLPLGVEDGRGKWESHKYIVSKVAQEHPDWLILDKEGKHARMTRDLAALCPAVPEVQAWYKKLTEKFIREWGFDGSKLDNIYTVPACYNPAHHHKSPQDSVNAMGEVYKTIFQTTRAIKPESVTQACPCGTPPSLAWLPFIDQAVTADPVGAVQVRRRTKMYKALLGPEAAVYGDHVELSSMTRVGNSWSEHGSDFASTIGTGGVVGTKFVMPTSDPKFKPVALTSDKEEHWKKWIGIYNQKMLSKGTFRNLYTYGYDAPEGYAIEKDGKMYYAFFSDSSKPWKGKIELRGLAPGIYHVADYGNGKDLGTIQAGGEKAPDLATEFKGHLLLEVSR